MRGPIRRSPPGAWQAAVAAALGAAAVLLTVLALLPWQPLAALDTDVASTLHTAALGNPGLTRANRVLTDWVWDPWAFRLLVAVVVVWLLWRGERALGWWLAGTVLVGSGLQQGLKAALARERPQWREPVDSAHYAAMPSGHAMTAALVCVVLLWLWRERGLPGGGVWWRSAAVIGCVSVVGVAFTRVWLGVHWLTDTLVGVLLGTALGLGSAAAWAALRAGGSRPEAARRPLRR
ncbi:phosphatase PAP2 family protein [Streptomyces tubbatahanensis]|uniref:Phosphatase PAP2 family protein n=1 Tax=Streptomyces tubbatahanensis TaxID=2923272 RepID=A0ABY3Y1C0_9ACTN|nr:phosphatase PAP2 family protein [Streptomyces tubbatahanensis]UNT00392.1 phosphatase PAP2 family protein [Streptomyces tubbatahanensis]